MGHDQLPCVRVVCMYVLSCLHYPREVSAYQLMCALQARTKGGCAYVLTCSCTEQWRLHTLVHGCMEYSDTPLKGYP